MQIFRTCSESRCGTGFLRFFENRIGSYIDVREKRKRRNTVKSQRRSRDTEQVLRGALYELIKISIQSQFANPFAQSRFGW